MTYPLIANSNLNTCSIQYGTGIQIGIGNQGVCHIYIYIYTYIYIFTCTHMQIYLYIHKHFLYIHICIFIDKYINIYIYIVHMYLSIHICIYIYSTYVFTYTQLTVYVYKSLYIQGHIWHQPGSPGRSSSLAGPPGGQRGPAPSTRSLWMLGG